MEEGPDVWGTWEDGFGEQEEEAAETPEEKGAAGD